jgi:hypothetical protein
VRPPKDARFVIDTDYRLAPAGLLAANGHRRAAERLLRLAQVDPCPPRAATS